MKYADPQLLDELAARYVLGLQALLVRRRFQRLAQCDAAAAAALRRWEGHAARLADVVPACTPRPIVWAGIERRISPSVVSAQPRGRLRWLRGAIGLAAVVLLAAGLVPLLAPFGTPAPSVADKALPASYVGILADPQGQARLLASVQRHARTLHFKWLGAPPVPAGTRLVLWALPADGPPFEIGAVPLADHTAINLPATAESLLSKVERLGVAAPTAGDGKASPPDKFLLLGHCAKLW